MKLETLLNIHGHIDWRKQDKNLQAKSLCTDSRQVEFGSLFIAIRGHSGDGHDYLEQVAKMGASALVVEDRNNVPDDYPGAVVEVLDSRLSLQTLSQIFYGSPGEVLLGIGVTGTNGKTSSCYILEYLLNDLGYECGVIGTIDHHLKSKVWDTQLTTPDPVTLQRRLRDFLDLGAKSFVIEASSHALFQNRINQGFDVTLFTNLSRDHLDYHKDMEDYFQAKALLFKEKMLKETADCMAVINGDDPFGQRLVKMTPGRRVYTFGKSEGVHLRFAIIETRLDGTDINLTIGDSHNFLVKSPLIGEHNVYNLVGGLATIYGLGLDLKKACDDILSFPGVPGRMQKVEGPDSRYGFVDYAHTPDALEKAIEALKPLIPAGNKLITVFGCGGDRDKGKRPIMGELATRMSDLTIVTSDNPRTEEPGQIIKEICAGVKDPKSVHLMPSLDREEAIEQACQLAQPGDAILVAGKGHENYQIIGTEKRHFNDYQTLKKHLT